MTGRLTPRLAMRPLDAVIRRMRAVCALSDAELELLRTLGERRERRPAGDELAPEGGLASRARFILSGWGCRQRVLPDGRRQIFSFLVPGDAVWLTRRLGPELSTTTTLTAVETIDAEPVLDAIDAGQAPGLARAIQTLERMEQGYLLDHIVRLGRQTAYERVAHLLLELQGRLEVGGLGDSQRFPLPLTQEVLADALGLSIVHVNRTLQQLRRERLIELRSGVAILLQPEALADIAGQRQPPPAPTPQPFRPPAPVAAQLEDSAPL